MSAAGFTYISRRFGLRSNHKGHHMTPSQADYYRDAAMMVALEGIPPQGVIIADALSETAEQFNAAIWAAYQLREITEDR